MSQDIPSCRGGDAFDEPLRGNSSPLGHRPMLLSENLPSPEGQAKRLYKEVYA